MNYYLHSYLVPPLAAIFSFVDVIMTSALGEWISDLMAYSYIYLMFENSAESCSIVRLNRSSRASKICDRRSRAWLPPSNWIQARGLHIIVDKKKAYATRANHVIIQIYSSANFETIQ